MNDVDKKHLMAAVILAGLLVANRPDATPNTAAQMAQKILDQQ